MSGNSTRLEKISSLRGVRKGVVEICESSLSALEPNQIRVDTQYSMISPGTELHSLLDNHTKRAEYPINLGYSTVGQIVGLGSAVEGWQIGDRVFASAFHAATNNSTPDSIHKLPDGIDPISACTSVLLAIALRSIRATQLRLGDSTVVFGLGLVGLYALHLARTSGAFPVIGIDPVKMRREQALKLGADQVIDPLNENVEQRIKDLTRHERAAVSIDATGSRSVVTQIPSMTSAFGKIAVLGGIHGAVQMDLYTHIQKSNQTLVGCGAASPRDYPHDDYRNISTMIAMIHSGMLRPRSAITHVVSWRRAPEMYQMLINNKEAALGVVFNWQE
jgi:2-desacetyl-2-hydroxyethyl bacteriochlorophyllide A dehydrogenase